MLAPEPGHPEAHLGIAHLLDLSGESSEAAVRLESLCEKQPMFAPAWLLRARIAMDEGDAAAARMFYDTAVDLDRRLLESPDPHHLPIEVDLPLGGPIAVDGMVTIVHGAVAIKAGPHLLVHPVRFSHCARQSSASLLKSLSPMRLSAQREALELLCTFRAA